MLDTAEELPAVRVQQAVLLSFDIVGFTAITDEIVRSSRLGSEEVAGATHAVLDEISAIAGNWGGEVCMFAGDSVLVGWFIHEPFDAATAARYAAAAALEVVAKSAGWRIGPLPIRVRTSIAAGSVQHAEVGGLGGRWLGLLTGAPFNDLATCESLAGPGEILVTPEAWTLLEPSCLGEPRTGGYRSLAQMQSAPTRPGRPGENSPRYRPRRASPPANVAPVMLHAADALAGRWHGEFHTLSIVFARLMPRSTPDFAKVETINALAEATQAATSKLGGFVYQLLAERGAIAAICVFGLPPDAHDDDPARAILAALALERGFSVLDFRADIGVTTGRVFCTIHGNARQAEFAVAGPAINLAARLASSGLGVVGDSATVQSALVRYDLGTRELPPLIVKGKAQPVTPYLLFEPPSRRLAGEGSAGNAPLRGRSAEIAEGKARLAELLGGRGSVLMIEGEAGIGKTALATHLTDVAAGSGIRCLAGMGDEIEGNTRYFPWRSVFAKLLGAGREGATTLRARLDALGLAAPETALLAAAIEGSPMDDDDSGLSDEGRDELTRRLLAEQIVALSEREPLVVLLEDYHWFDPSSRRLLIQLAEARARVLIIVTTRPVTHEDQERLTGAGAAVRLTLRPLGPDESIEAFSAHFGADRAALDLREMVQKRTGGNPLFIGELARLLRDNHTVEVIAGEVVGRQESSADQVVDEVLRSSGAPATIEGLVMARLNSLPAAVRRLVGTASVFGRVFDAARLKDVAQCSSDDLRRLLASDLFVVGEAADLYAFRHAILRDVAYHALSHRDRSALHGSLANRIEASEDGQAGRLDEVLAYHFDEAGLAERALFYMMRAGKLELHNNANREAYAHFSRALKLLDGPENASLRADRIIEAELGLGEAAQRMSSYAEADEYATRALRRMGTAIPETMPGLILAILREAAVQIIHRRVPEHWWHHGDPGDSERVSLELGILVEVYFYLGKSFHSLYAALKALNVAERAGPSEALSRALALIGTMTGFVGLSRTGERYCDRALSVLATIEKPVAAWWVRIAVGIARMSAGDLDRAGALFAEATTLAEKVGERRSWRDAVENTAIIAAMRGDWSGALGGVAKYRTSAMADRDRRYLVAALREQAYYLLQLGYYTDAADSVALLRAEIERGIKAEADVSRLDLHAIAGTLAIEGGDDEAAARDAEAAMQTLASIGGAMSFPNMHWAMLLLARLNARLWNRRRTGGEAASKHRRWGKVISRALNAHASAHPVARPAAYLGRGLLERLRGNDSRARRHFVRAASEARALGLAHEAALADHFLKLSNLDIEAASTLLAAHRGPMVQE